MILSGGATAYAQNADPTVTASRTPTGAVRVGVPIQFTAVGTDADSDTLTYAWTFGDATTSTEQNPSKTYLAAGTYTATVTVSDGKGGSATASITGISIQANRAPSITVGSATPAAGVVPFTTQLAATATDADGHTITYAWDLDGDGTFETSERNPSLNLTSAGDKTVTLRASDPFGGVATRAVTIGALAATPDPTKKYHVLIFSKTAGFRHGSIGPGITAIKLLGQQNNFGVDAIEDASLFTDAFLARYDAVIWLSTTGDALNDTQQAAFERYIKGGGGYVGIHAASDTEYTWPWYGQLVGGYFRNHPSGTPTATVVREDATHVSTSHLPERWTRVDEWYNFQGIVNPVINGGGTDVSPRGLTPIHVLLTVDESTYSESDGNTTDDDHPVSWCKRFDGGRMFYTALGHTNQSFSEVPFLQHLQAGIDVATGFTSDLSCGIYKTSTTGDVGASVPATLSLALSTPRAFGAFIPGVNGTYETTATATAISSGGDGQLSVSDPSSTATGRLVNGTFSLPQPLEAKASSAAGTGGAFAPLSTTGSPLGLLTYSGPVSNDAATVSFRQMIGAGDALRTGTYAKTLTFTLSTTMP
jgi:PKD repeat protein